jgi:hypothetical protein
VLMTATFSVFGGPPKFIFTLTSTVFLIIGLLCLCVGWAMVFSRRPGPKNIEE